MKSMVQMLSLWIPTVFRLVHVRTANCEYGQAESMWQSVNELITKEREEGSLEYNCALLYSERCALLFSQSLYDEVSKR